MSTQQNFYKCKRLLSILFFVKDVTIFSRIFFVKTIKEQHGEACLVDAIVAMAKGLKMNIVAEGVETEQQLDYLTSLGCRNIQGWLFGKARSGVEIASELNSQGMATVALSRPQ